MKAVLMSIQPKWAFLIIAKKIGWNIGAEKTIEVRKDLPKAGDWNKKVKIYCSKNRKSFAKIPKDYQPLMEKFLGKVIGEFVCDRISEYRAEFTDLHHYDAMNEDVCLNEIKKVGYYDEDDGDRNYYYETSNAEENPDDCELLKGSCLTFNEVRKYIGSTFYDKSFYGWHITDLKIYDKPKELSEFYNLKKCNSCKVSGYESTGCSYINCKVPARITRPPQSWCYVEELKEQNNG